MLLANSPSDLITTPVVLLASVWIAVWSFSRWRKLRKKKLAASTTGSTTLPIPRARAEDALVAANPRTAQPRPSLTASDVRSLAVELQQLLADLNDTSRRMAAQMDNRHTRLEALVVEADQKIARLEALQRKPSQAPDQETDPHADLACVTTHLNAIASSIHAPCSTSKDILHAPIDPTHRKIYDLADKGQSPRDIAQQLTKHPGEVELILALRRRSAV